MASVQLKDIKKRFGKTEVLHGITMDIENGEFIVIVGPSGCGKSTLLRMVAGLESISEGDIFIGSRQVNDLEPMERDIAMVFQNYALYPHMSVRQNMAYGLKIAGNSKAEINEKVDKAAQMLQLEDYLDRKPRQLSGGQRQRVAMGRAIVREPAVFLFDEPLSNLDAKLRVQMRLEIRELQARLGITALYVTHDQVEAMTMADRMIVMNAGIAEQIGTPLDVYQRPETVFAAQFIGSPAMNILSGRMANGVVTLDSGAELRCDKSFNGDVRVGIRPEHLVIGSDGPFAMAIGAAEPLGANTLLHGKLGTSDMAFSASVPGVYHRDDSVEKIHFSVDSDNLHFFDASTGRRL